jgi:hypothetical protein
MNLVPQAATGMSSQQKLAVQEAISSMRTTDFTREIHNM